MKYFKFIYAIAAFLLTSGILFKTPVLSATNSLASIYPSDSFLGEFKSLVLLIFRADHDDNCSI